MTKSQKKYKKAWFFGKTIIVTGGGSGFGKLLCEKLVTRYDCTVIAVGRTRSKLVALRNELESAGFKNKVFYKAFDAGVEQNWIDFAAELKEKNVLIDVLINNAGILPLFSRFENADILAMEQAFNCNFFSQVYSVKHILPLIKKRAANERDNYSGEKNSGGDNGETRKKPRKRADCGIINVSSSACLACVVGTAAYSASKSAAASFTKILALENDDVYVSLVMPGFASTDIFRSQKSVSDKESALIAKVCGNPDKMTDKMLKAFVKRKKRVIVGADAKAMGFFGSLFPQTTDKAIKAVLKKAKLDIFSGVFE